MHVGRGLLVDIVCKATWRLMGPVATHYWAYNLTSGPPNYQTPTNRLVFKVWGPCLDAVHVMVMYGFQIGCPYQGQTVCIEEDEPPA